MASKTPALSQRWLCWSTVCHVAYRAASSARPRLRGRSSAIKDLAQAGLPLAASAVIRVKEEVSRAHSSSLTSLGDGGTILPG